MHLCIVALQVVHVHLQAQPVGLNIFLGQDGLDLFLQAGRTVLSVPQLCHLCAPCAPADSLEAGRPAIAGMCHCSARCLLQASGQASMSLLLEDPQCSSTAWALASRQRRPLSSWGPHLGICVGVQSDLQAVLQVATQVLALLLVDCFPSSESPLVDTTVNLSQRQACLKGLLMC